MPLTHQLVDVAVKSVTLEETLDTGGVSSSVSQPLSAYTSDTEAL